MHLALSRILTNTQNKRAQCHLVMVNRISINTKPNVENYRNIWTCIWI